MHRDPPFQSYGNKKIRVNLAQPRCDWDYGTHQGGCVEVWREQGTDPCYVGSPRVDVLMKAT